MVTFLNNDFGNQFWICERITIPIVVDSVWCDFQAVICDSEIVQALAIFQMITIVEGNYIKYVLYYILRATQQLVKNHTSDSEVCRRLLAEEIKEMKN